MLTASLPICVQETKVLWRLNIEWRTDDKQDGVNQHLPCRPRASLCSSECAKFASFQSTYLSKLCRGHLKDRSNYFSLQKLMELWEEGLSIPYLSSHHITTCDCWYYRCCYSKCANAQSCSVDFVWWETSSQSSLKHLSSPNFSNANEIARSTQAPLWGQK